MAGHEFRVWDIEIIVSADTMIFERIQAAAKLALDHNGVQSRLTKLAIEVGKLRRADRLVQHLPDDLLLGHSEQCSVLLGGGCLANGFKEDRQQLLLICQRENDGPVHLFGG